MASRTSAMRMNCLSLLPLLDPLRAAEDIAVLDLVSGGRTRRRTPGGPPR